MAGQRGFLYEKSIFNKLKGKGITPRGSKPAGANPNLPDAVFVYQGQPYNLEIKLDHQLLEYDYKYYYLKKI